MTMPALLRLPDVAKMLDVTPETLRSWVSAGRFLAPRKLGASLVWPEEALAEYLRTGLPPVSAQAAQEPAK